MHKAKSAVLNGQPCRAEHRMESMPAMCPLICRWHFGKLKQSRYRPGVAQRVPGS